MRIASIHDPHWGAGMDDDVGASFDQIIDALKGVVPGLIVLPGDIYDGITTPEIRNACATKIRRLAEFAEVHMVYGNHDREGDLELLARQRARFPIVAHSTYECVEIGGLAVHFFPWATKASWLMTHTASRAESDSSVSQLALEFLRLQVARRPGMTHVLVAHLMIRGARAENHQPLKGEGVTLGAFDLEEAGFHAGILGHIHLMQEISNLVFYAGSVAPLNYGESPDKYWAVTDTDERTLTFYKLQTVDRFSIDGVWDQNGFTPAAPVDPGRVRGARVRVTCQVPDGTDLAAVRARLREEYEKFQPLEFKVETQVRPKDQVRSELISRARTSRDKLEAFWEATGRRPDEATQAGMFEKLSTLEAEVK